jgi:hypothetical protein
MQCIRRANSIRDVLILTLSPAAPYSHLLSILSNGSIPIQHTKEGDIGRENTILMTSLQLEDRRREQTATSFHPPSPHI